MIDIEGIPPFLRIALPVVMETMHFPIGQTNLFLGQLCFAFWAPNKQFGFHEKLSWGTR